MPCFYFAHAIDSDSCRRVEAEIERVEKRGLVEQERERREFQAC